MKLKFIAVTIILSALLIPTIQSCKKYPDGPTISLRSRAERVANTWKVENYKINGNDYTSLVSSYTETYTKQGAYSYSWGIVDGSGTWSFQNSDTEIKIRGTDNQASRKLTILKLEEKSFWYYYFEGNDKHELHLIGN
ncbi:MAG: hypothetical protein Q8T03_08755 [Bacteroidota bacterium]|nr:hypothetical protein [Bacteroidota bacterium]